MIGVIRREKKLIELEMPRSDSSVRNKPVVYTSPRSPVALPLKIQQSTLGQSVKEGFGFGVGSSIARTAIDSFFDRMKEPSKEVKKASCKPEEKDYESCILTNQGGSNCEYYSYAYMQCIKNQNSMK